MVQLVVLSALYPANPVRYANYEDYICHVYFVTAFCLFAAEDIKLPIFGHLLVCLLGRDQNSCSYSQYWQHSASFSLHFLSQHRSFFTHPCSTSNQWGDLSTAEDTFYYSTNREFKNIEKFSSATSGFTKVSLRG